MSILNFSRRKQLDEANEKALTPVCSVHVQKIFALLHAKAVMEAEKAGVKIENTAADGNDPKNAVFHSAGEHMIVARNAKEGEKIEKEKAFNAIQTYIGIFCGEDIAKNLKDDECFALKNDETGTAVSEAIDGNHIFSRYLVESAKMTYVIEDSAEDEDDEDAGNERDDTDTSDDSDADDSTAADDEDDADEDDDSDDGDEADDDASGEDDDSEDEGGESDGEDKDAENEEDPSKVQEANAFYILYGLKIKGLKETTVSDALKQWGSNFLKGFGVKIDSLWGPGGSGDVHTVAGLVKNLRGLFGAIDDPDELSDRVQEQMRQKFPKVGEITCEFRDKKTLVRELDKRNAKQPYVEGWPDGKNKQKINSAEYSMYIHVDGDDLKEPYINRKVIANMVTLQIKGLFKKFKNMIKADDVIYIKGSQLKGNVGLNGEDINFRAVPTYTYLYNKLYPKKKFVGQAALGDVIKDFEQKFKIMKTAKGLDKVEEAKTLMVLWEDFFKKCKIEETPVVEEAVLNEFLSKYKDAYTKFSTKFSASAGDDLDESVYTAYDIIRDLFESHVDGDGLTDIYEQPPEYLVLAEDDEDPTKPLTSDQKSKLQGPIMDEIVKIANDTCKAKKNKVKFTSGMAKFARVDIDVCSNIENCEAATYNLIEPVLEKTKNSEHLYFIMAYFKIPKEIENSHIKGKNKKDVNETDVFDETEILDEADNKTIQYLKKSGLSKEDALKDEEIEKIRKTYNRPPSVEKVKQDIEKYFEKIGGRTPAKAGSTWKGTPGQEGFTEENMKKAFQLAIDGEVYDFQRYTREAASDKFKYYDTDVPADVDVFFALADKLNGIDPPPPPPSQKEKKVYFAVSEDLENPDFTKIQKFLNDENPVKVEDITDELLGKLQEEAESYVGTLNKSTLTEDEDEEDDIPDDDDDESGESDESSEKKVQYVFETWTPDPKNPPDEPNRKGPDGEEDAIIICAKFKKEEGGGPGPGPKPPDPEPNTDPESTGDSEPRGDDLYIIPMPGVKYSDIDDEGFTKTM